MSRKEFFLLHTFGPNFEQGASWSREIQRELNRQSPWPLNIQEQSLVTALDGNDIAEGKFVEYLKALYAQRPPDLIVSLGAPAARFIQLHRADLFPPTPMLLAAVEVRRVEPSILSGQDAVAGVRYDQVAAIENILRLLPETKAIAIIIGKSPGERFWAGDTNGYWVRCWRKGQINHLRRAAVRGNLEGGCEFAAPQCNLLSAASRGWRRCRLWRQGATEAHLRGRQRSHIFVRPDLF